MLPDLDTACFDATLPLAVAPLPGTATLGRETRLALRVLAAPAPREEDEAGAARLEAKLDLALEVALMARRPHVPGVRDCRIGLDALAWHEDDAHRHAAGDTLLVTLFPHPDSALALELPVRVEQPAEGGRGCLARLLPVFDEAGRQMWERWVFRRHRLALQRR
ncbi:atypical PilZ domain-containing cyclic di-GMP receptor [Crenobacter luteus]|uniref:hypothetical protein n=1 Tax=Crenobacter luteus TaxID=1452487 RepID=UPI001048A191|nr:hypothetical protein [Crenobacter luteus]TCP15516.1 atypical PilZ domain-containing cyclic di-GMP receptor [Crenobacter luteus]